MANKIAVAELQGLLVQDNEAQWVAHLWDKFHSQRQGWLAEKDELRNFIFATDTTTTTNQELPWKNSTTLPKLCQIRDNLHSNYVSALFPNDQWLRWDGYQRGDATKKKVQSIQSYMENKTREGHFRTETSKLLYDYIDFGNAFAMPVFEASYRELADGQVVADFVGCKARRISPLDIVFNPLAATFEDSFKIIRSVKTMGELKKLAATHPEEHFWEEALQRRTDIQNRLGAFNSEDTEKAVAYSVDGFGNLHEYYMSNFVEVLEFYGDYHDNATGELKTNRLITIVDRSFMVRDVELPNWFSHASIYHVGWRLRPDNLYAMGALDNLVGMQYRIDHLENLKADAMDLIVHPPLVIAGEVEEFEWKPNAEIHIDENGSVSEVAKNVNNILIADNQIAELESRMELFAGAPREAMGVRTAGEKTAFEVQQLSNAAGRIFQEKITHFEQEMLEPLLNGMLETSVRNMDGSDIIRVLDNELGFTQFLTITKEDITANGVIRPIGARHFAKQATDLQNLIGVFNSPIGQMVAPHTSGKNMARFVDDVVGLDAYNIFQPNVAIDEQAETQSLINQGAEDLEVQQDVPVEE